MKRVRVGEVESAQGVGTVTGASPSIVGLSGTEALVSGIQTSAAAQASLRAYPPFVDAMEFARRSQVIEGEFNIHRLQRLLDGLPSQPDTSLVHYVVKGHSGPDGRPRLTLRVKAEVVLECQRCLGDLQLPIDHEAVFELVRHESELEAEELEESGPDWAEKILGSPRFDLGELVEDELILEVPYVPKHANCASGALGSEDGAGVDPSQEDVRPSPFAVLGQLKNKSK
jgi:uncharacterized protein